MEKNLQNKKNNPAHYEIGLFIVNDKCESKTGFGNIDA
jgi:hypothetical protein